MKTVFCPNPENLVANSEVERKIFANKFWKIAAVIFKDTSFEKYLAEDGNYFVFPLRNCNTIFDSPAALFTRELRLWRVKYYETFPRRNECRVFIENTAVNLVHIDEIYEQYQKDVAAYIARNTKK